MERDLEDRIREALGFVRVKLDNGYLTPISISMLLAQIRYDGMEIVDRETVDAEER
jgi:hypothetical protein